MGDKERVLRVTREKKEMVFIRVPVHLAGDILLEIIHVRKNGILNSK